MIMNSTSILGYAIITALVYVAYFAVISKLDNYWDNTVLTVSLTLLPFLLLAIYLITI